MTAFEDVYRTYFNDVFLYIRRLSGDEHIAEEITSETFFKAMHSINSFRGDCELRVWLCQIAKNSYLSYIKKANKISSIEEIVPEKLPATNRTMEETVTQQEEVMHLQQHLHNIAEPYREVFMWRVFAELSFKQIGQIFNKSENWACVTYHRAKSMIKQRMED